MYYRETSAARTELAQGTEAKVRTQNFRKAPRQCDRSLHKEPRQRDRSLRKEPRQRDRSLRKEPPLSLCGIALNRPACYLSISTYLSMLSI
mgnify:CR=1 FL=1